MSGREVAVRSRTTRGVAYRVLIGIDGSLSCTCAGFEFKRHCWHIEHVEKNEMTNDEHALVPIKVEPPKAVLPSREELNVIGLIAKSVLAARGHAVPKEIDSTAKAAAVMLAGHELGVKPMTALRHIMVINGKTEPDAQLMAGIVQASERDARIEVVELSDQRCTMRLVRPSRGINAEYTYELADAKKAGLVKQGSNWDRFPKDMMRWAATKRLCRAYASDLINSVGGVEVGAAGELMEVVEHDVIDQEPDGYLEAGDVPAEALYSEGDEPEGDEPEGDVPAEAPANVDPETGETGEILEDEPAEGEFTEEDDDAPSNAPLGDAAMTAGIEWLDEAAKAAKVTRGDVLDALNADVVQVAADLEAAKRRWAQMQPSTAPAKEAPARKAPAPPSVEDAKDRGSLLTYFLRRHSLSKSQLQELTKLDLEELDVIAEKEGGWPQAAKFIEDNFVTTGAAS